MAGTSAMNALHQKTVLADKKANNEPKVATTGHWHAVRSEFAGLEQSNPEEVEALKRIASHNAPKPQQ